MLVKLIRKFYENYKNLMARQNLNLDLKWISRRYFLENRRLMDIVGRCILKNGWSTFVKAVVSFVFDVLINTYWLSIVYVLRDKNLKDLLVFRKKSKI